MKLTSRKIEHERKIELSMTSMIDVVFLLLIFFMVTSSFVKPEKHHQINPGANSVSAAASDLEPALVEVLAGDAGFVFKVGTREITDQDELTNVLRASFPNKLDGAYVRVSDDAPVRMAQIAIQACKDAGFDVVTYVPPD